MTGHGNGKVKRSSRSTTVIGSPSPPNLPDYSEVRPSRTPPKKLPVVHVPANGDPLRIVKEESVYQRAKSAVDKSAYYPSESRPVAPKPVSKNFKPIVYDNPFGSNTGDIKRISKSPAQGGIGIFGQIGQR